MLHHRSLFLFASVLVGAAACSDDATSTPPVSNAAESAGRFVLLTNLERSAFLGTTQGIRAGSSFKTDVAREVATYAYAYLDGQRVFVPQNQSSDEVLRFEIGADGALAPSGKLVAPPSSFPAAIVLASQTKGFLSLTGAGKVLVFDPGTMTTTGEIDLNGAANAAPDPEGLDVNPDPSSMTIRDGKLFVALWQTKAAYTPRPGVSIAVINAETNTLEKVIKSERGLSAAGRPGEVDALVADEKGDLYVYASGGFGLDPSLHHGFLRIPKGSTDFDDYLWDLSDQDVEVQGRRIDFCNAMRWARGGRMICAGNVPPLNSNPPDFVNDYPIQIVKLDLYAKAVVNVPLPLSNANAGGAMEVDGDNLFVSIAARTGVGLFSYDLAKDVASSGPVLTSPGFISVVRRVP